jgi:IS5 family transposase
MVMDRRCEPGLDAEGLELIKPSKAIETMIGQLKEEHRFDRCHLKGEIGCRLHAVLSVADYNNQWRLSWLGSLKTEA